MTRTTYWTQRARTGAAALALAVLALAGCGDSTEPVTDYDPIVTLDQLEDVLTPIESSGDLLYGLDLAVATLDYYGSGFLADAVRLRPVRGRELLRAVRPRLDRPGTAGEEEGTAVPSSAASAESSAAPAPFTLPAGFTGRTLVWDAVEGYVVSARTGASPSGTRFILYRMDPESGYPASPLAEVGHLDLVDVDGTRTEGVRVTATRTAGPAREVADYTVRLAGSGSYLEGSMEVTTEGGFGETGAVELDLLQRLEWSEGQDRDELTLDYRFERGSRSVTLDGRADSRFEALSWDRFEFDMGFRGSGPVVEIDAAIGTDGALRGEIRRDGRRAVRLDGYDGRPTFEGVNGLRLGWSDVSTLEELWMGIGDLIWLTDWVMAPADLLVLDG